MYVGRNKLKRDIKVAKKLRWDKAATRLNAPRPIYHDNRVTLTSKVVGCCGSGRAATDYSHIKTVCRRGGLRHIMTPVIELFTFFLKSCFQRRSQVRKSGNLQLVLWLPTTPIPGIILPLR
jgi:hypothetical protein